MIDKLRITGLATGMDVDAMVKSMMKAENMRLDKIKQDRQIVQWKQDLYREILGDINTLKSTYFDVLKSDSYMLSANNYAGLDASTDTTNTVRLTPGAGAAAGTYTLSNIKIAQKASKTGSVINIEQSNNAIANPLTIGSSNNTLSVKINGGTAYDITLTSKTYDGTPGNTIDDLISDINTQLQSIPNNLSNGVLKAQKSPDGTKIQFVGGTTDGTSNTDAASINISGTALGSLGFVSSSIDVNQTVDDKMSNLFNGPVSFSINNGTENITLSYDFTSGTGTHRDWTITQVLNDISSKAKVNISYSELSRKFAISSQNTGSAQVITASDDSGAFVSKLFGGNVNAQGSDAALTIKNPSGESVYVVKPNNNFTIDGVNYSLLKDNTSTVTVDLTTNPQKVFDKIKAFIDKYNEIIGKIQAKISEKKQYDYKPLTDDQKKEMTEDEIKKWEEKAKEGILKNDGNLQNLLYAMRSAFYDLVEGAGISLKDAGLSTYSDYSQGGKIIIDEAKLKSAIQNHGDQVAKLFMQDSSISYDPDHKDPDPANGIYYKKRYNESGIFQRINDILKDYTRTTRDSQGKKGILIEIAGIKGDTSEFTSLLSKQLKDDYDDRIYELTRKLAEKENKYYMQFSQLEVAMQNFNTQSSWLRQQLGL